MKPPGLAVRSDQYEYIQLVLLAVVVGVLGALGNLGFRALILFFSWMFRGAEWNALGIWRGALWRGLIPLVLLSGGVFIVLLD